jgi:hypothetical protein
MVDKKLYEKKAFVYTIQTVTILLILFTKVDLILKVMLLFGYFMLFRQTRWHKHLLIMCAMISILFISTQIYM